MLIAGTTGNATGFVAAVPVVGSTTSLPWSKTLGTVAAGGALTGIALDTDGGIWVTGYTKDPNYPVTNDAYQKSGPTPTSFGTPIYGVLTKLSADGTTIIYSTFLGDGTSACVGGSSCIGVFGNTLPAGVAVATDGSIVVAGNTTAPNFPVTTNAIVPTLKSQYGNGFVTSFAPGGKALRYSTFLGGTGFGAGMEGDTLKFIAAESGGNVLVAGETYSSDFPVTATALQPAHAGYLANWSISRISAAGTLLYSSYYGGSGSNSLGGMAEDSAGNIWLAGQTASTDFPLLPGSLRLGTDALVELDSTAARVLVTQLLPAGSADEALNPDSTGKPVILGSSGSILRLTTQGAAGSQVLGFANAAAPVLSRYIAPGEIVSLYGTGLATGDPVSAVIGANGKLPTTLNGVSIGTPAGLASILYASSTQVNFIVPLDLDTTTGFQTLVFQQGNTLAFITPYAKLSQPEIAVVLNPDFTLNSRTNPAAADSTVVIYLFGGGAFQGNPPDGTIAGNTLWAPVLDVTSNLGKISYAGSAPGLLLGVMQVNVQLTPLPAAPSYVSLNLLVGYETSNSVEVFLK